MTRFGAVGGIPRELGPVILAAGIAVAGYMLESRGVLETWVRALPFVLAWLIVGWPVLRGAARNIARGQVFDELFLMSIATIGAILVGAWEEAVGVMAFYRVGEFLQEKATEKSRASIRSLLDQRVATARLRIDGQWSLLDAGKVVKGDLLLVLPGESVPVDGTVESGRSFIDTRTLTGEPAPRSVGPDSAIMGSSIALDGSLEIRAHGTVAESKAARIIDLVEEASGRKAKTERMVTRFARWYTPLVVGLALATAFLPPLLLPGQSLSAWVYRALVMLVISCPCALVLSIPLGYLAGLGGTARRGILVRGGEVLDALARVNRVVLDKTGTVTTGSFTVTAVCAASGTSVEELLSVAGSAESRSRHPLARAILHEAFRRSLVMAGADQGSEFREHPGRGVAAQVGGQSVVVGNEELMAMEGVELPGQASTPLGSTVAHVAVGRTYAGWIAAGDTTRPESPAALAELRFLGVENLSLLTGDARGPAEAVAASLGIADCRASLDPSGKLREFEIILRECPVDARTGVRRNAVLFAGDGTNDAPVIARADVGVAMGGGSDAAIGTADVVLLSDDLGRIPEAIRHARAVKAIIGQNIVLALGVKSSFLVLAALGAANMWLAVIADVGVALVAVLNSTRALRSPRSRQRTSGR
ncbi:MAG: heavy metal translocating P-type ATPase [Spirochaetota bacterium]